VFDVLSLNGKDVRKLALLDRKRLLHAIVPNRSMTIVATTHVAGRGRDLFAEVCAQDLEGIVAKRADSVYDATARSHRVKIKNPEFSQAVDRHEIFERA
jgi:bifunctional non-homologous end joining protein LigD